MRFSWIARFQGWLGLGLCLLSTASLGQTRIASAASLAGWLQTQVADEQGVDVIVGSSGKLATQILYGAPYDLFLSADAERPQRLLDKKAAKSCEALAPGRLAVWHRHESSIPDDWPQARLSIAQPKLAPYGLAAQQSLQALAIWPKAKSQLLIAENVAQALQYAHTGHADYALISWQQVQQSPHGNYRLIEETKHQPIRHTLCLLNNKADSLQWFQHLKSHSSPDE